MKIDTRKVICSASQEEVCRRRRRRHRVSTERCTSAERALYRKVSDVIMDLNLVACRGTVQRRRRIHHTTNKEETWQVPAIAPANLTFICLLLNSGSIVCKFLRKHFFKKKICQKSLWYILTHKLQGCMDVSTPPVTSDNLNIRSLGAYLKRGWGKRRRL